MTKSNTIETIAFDNTPVVISSILIEDCCMAIANGYTMTEWCRSKGINYGSFRSELRRTKMFEVRIMEAELAREEWLKEELLKLMRDITQLNPQSCFDDKGHYLGINGLPENAAKLIKKAKVRLQSNGPDEPPDEILEIEFYDKQKSIDQIGKYIQMFVERIEVSHKVTLEETVTRSFEADILAKRQQQGEIIDAEYSDNALLNTALQKESD